MRTSRELETISGAQVHAELIKALNQSLANFIEMADEAESDLLHNFRKTVTPDEAESERLLSNFKKIATPDGKLDLEKVTLSYPTRLSKLDEFTPEALEAEKLEFANSIRLDAEEHNGSRIDLEARISAQVTINFNDWYSVDILDQSGECLLVISVPGTSYKGEPRAFWFGTYE